MGTHNPTLHQDQSPDTWPPENLECLLGMQANCHTRDFHTQGPATKHISVGANKMQWLRKWKSKAGQNYGGLRAILTA